MGQHLLPQYPVYIPSKGRWETRLTAKFLLQDGVPFRLVVEPQEYAKYADAVGKEHLLVLPFSNLGLGSIPARNWIWEHAKSAGYKRHWILDDNIFCIKRRLQGKRIPCEAGAALHITENFVERYENVAIAGLNYEMFLPNGSNPPPFSLNVHVYSCLLILNSLPQRWRGRYNEDTDLCLQVLSAGWCTILMNAFLIQKARTMTMKGGNSDQLYQGDGRLKMARSLERVWPYAVETKRRFKRPQHVIRDAWKKFDTQLKRRADVDWSQLEGNNEYGMTLEQVKPQIKSEAVKTLKNSYIGEKVQSCQTPK